MIPPESRAAILRARQIAQTVGGQVRLIVEAEWQHSDVTAFSIPAMRDPLLVITKGDQIAYIERFDCTDGPLVRSTDRAA